MASEFPERVRQMDEVQHEDERCLLRLWTASHARPEHVQRVDRPPAMLAFVGNPTLVGESAASWPALLKDSLNRGAPALDAVWPPFCAFLRDLAADTLTIVADRSALQHLYIRQDPRGTVWASTSAFALASLGAEFDVEAATEWATAGHFITGRTFFRGVRELDCGEVVHLRPGAAMTRTTWVPTPRGETTATAYRETVEEAVGAYSQQEDGLFFELTGGIDSRLLLAARTRSGARTRTWTVGQSDDVEMRTIEKLRGAATFEHLLVSPDAGFPAELPELIDEMHALADGEANALVYTSLLVAFRELAGIRRTSVTGSNGELARAFYWGAIARGRRQESNVRGVVIDTLVQKIFRESGGVRSVFRPDLPDPEAPVRQATTDFIRDVPSPNPVCDPRRLLSPHADAQVRGPQHQHHKPLLRAGGPIFRSSASRRHSRSSSCPEAGRSRRARDDRRSFTSARGRSARVGRNGPAIVVRAPLTRCATRDGARTQGDGAIRRPLGKDARSRSRGLNALPAGRGG